MPKTIRWGPSSLKNPTPAVPIDTLAPVPDLPFTAEEPDVTAAEPELDALDRAVTTDTAFAASRSHEAVPSWQPSSTTERAGERFSGFA